MTDEWHELREELLSDPETREAYERLRPGYEQTSGEIESKGGSLLHCVECGREPTDAKARGWRAVLTGGYEDEPEATAVYCPVCARREFG